jgi:CRISPR system Cascade subunit CasD
MSTLLLRLAAPLQSWGFASRFDIRDTAREPTKSGVIGLLAAALGRSRTENMDDLERLDFGVRIDQPGTLLRDYHIARRRTNSNRPNEAPKYDSYQTYRHYLADAVFLVGLEGEEWLLQRLMIALQNPVFPLYLGRRSCPPAGQLVLGLRDKPLLQALEEEPWQASEWYRNQIRKKHLNQVKLTIVNDAKPNEQGVFFRRDLPVSFDQRHRLYEFRIVMDTVDAVSIKIPQPTAEIETEHDAMAGWGD